MRKQKRSVAEMNCVILSWRFCKHFGGFELTGTDCCESRETGKYGIEDE